MADKYFHPTHGFCKFTRSNFWQEVAGTVFTYDKSCDILVLATPGSTPLLHNVFFLKATFIKVSLFEHMRECALCCHWYLQRSA